MNALIDCIGEQNAKVAASGEETLVSVMPEVREELEKNLATVIGSLSSNLVSNNALVRSNASQCLLAVRSHFSATAVAKPLLNRIQQSNGKAKAALVD